MAELRCLTQYCDYGTVLNVILRDRLVFRVNHSQIQQAAELMIIINVRESPKHCNIRLGCY